MLATAVSAHKNNNKRIVQQVNNFMHLAEAKKNYFEREKKNHRRKMEGQKVE